MMVLVVNGRVSASEPGAHTSARLGEGLRPSGTQRLLEDIRESVGGQNLQIKSKLSKMRATRFKMKASWRVWETT